MTRVRVALLGFLLTLPTFAHAEAQERWWWDEAWWSEGALPRADTYAVETHTDKYLSGDVEVPVFIARPKGRQKYPGVLFVHGRRGLDDWNRLHAVRLAARGFVVYAPDLYTGRFIDQFPNEHDYQLEEDLDKALSAMLKRKDLTGPRVCTVGVSRGGYYTLKLAVTKGRQKKDIACYVGYYPHMQDPNAPEPLQVYQYAPEVDRLEIPVLALIGEQEQYHRRRVIESSVAGLVARGNSARLIVYPGVGRGFDFRGGNLRTFADDLAAKDAVVRTTAFIKGVLAVR